MLGRCCCHDLPSVSHVNLLAGLKQLLDMLGVCHPEVLSDVFQGPSSGPPQNCYRDILSLWKYQGVYQETLLSAAQSPVLVKIRF